MKKRGISYEFYYQLITLLIFITLVHGFYSTVVRPRASAFLAENQRLATTGGDISGRKSPWVVLKDYEQESCFMLMFWAFAIIGYKAVQVFGDPQHDYTKSLLASVPGRGWTPPGDLAPVPEEIA